MTVMCLMCEERPVATRVNLAHSNLCNPCAAANHALLRYWIRLDMPLSWATPRTHMRLYQRKWRRRDRLAAAA